MTELIIYAAIAFGLCAILYALLGRDVGHSGDKTFLDVQFGPAPDAEKPQSALELAIDSMDVSDNTAAGLKAIFQADKDFRPKAFLDGANAAYAMILEAYADGDRETLSELVTDEVYAVYDAAITARDKKKQTQVTDIARIKEMSLVGAELLGEMAIIDVRFVAELASVLKDKDDEVIEGDMNIVSEVDEVWTFERNIRSDDPSWRLAAVEEEGEDTPGSAPDVAKS